MWQCMLLFESEMRWFVFSAVFFLRFFFLFRIPLGITHLFMLVCMLCGSLIKLLLSTEEWEKFCCIYENFQCFTLTLWSNKFPMTQTAVRERGKMNVSKILCDNRKSATFSRRPFNPYLLMAKAFKASGGCMVLWKKKTKNLSLIQN